MSKRKRFTNSPERARAIEVWKQRQAVPETDVHKLLHQVVMAVLTTGNGHLLHDLPDVLAYFGSKLPTVQDVVGRPVRAEEIVGEVRANDAIYKFSCERTKMVGEN